MTRARNYSFPTLARSPASTARRGTPPFQDRHDEAVLRRVLGGPEVMREQYEHLAELAARDHVTVQILPLNQPVYRCGQNFILMEFEPPLPTVVSVDGFSSVNVTDKDTEIWAYRRRFDAMRSEAGRPRETPEFLK
ncbi:DUF5753 domain-containing protein [Streptomyces tailanensis]|uniref:DUF5753 domain-containing protein n=1 Tax=Streptomyces tailanensis TaxID=2569858 RepID=UPI001C0ED2E9|nr:DUF5753 domain-containing protein [Streptomyces tailanensis]